MEVKYEGKMQIAIHKNLHLSILHVKETGLLKLSLYTCGALHLAALGKITDLWFVFL